MLKNEFFRELNKRLGTKYDLLPQQISTIRSLHLGEKKTRKELAEMCAIKLSSPRFGKKHRKPPHRHHNLKYYQRLLNFLASCSEESWNEITVKTEFDKNG